MSLSSRESFSIATSSTAPLYAVIVTAPLIVELVGAAAPLIYLLAAVPALLVCAGMIANDKELPDKGSVYTWGKHPTVKWWSGFALASTGVIATSGLIYVAADLIIGERLTDTPRVLAVLALSGVLAGGAWVLNEFSVRLTSWLQWIGIGIQLVAVGTLIYQMTQTTLSFPEVTLSAQAVFHGVLLAVFAYWGFDAVFALAEESKRSAPRIASMSSIVAMAIFFIVGTTALMTLGIEAVSEQPLIVVATVVSAVMSLGSTMIPTVRGLQSMADNNDVPAYLRDGKKSGMTVFLLAWAWTGLVAVHEGLFNDTIEALSVFVGIYFTASSWAAWQRTRKPLHLASVLLMTAITLCAGIWMGSPDYGSTVFLGVGGTLWLVGVIASTGALLYTYTRYNKRKAFSVAAEAELVEA